MEMGFEQNQRFTDLRREDLFYVSESNASGQSKASSHESDIVDNSFETKRSSNEVFPEQRFPDGHEICNASISMAAYRGLNQSARSYRSTQRLDGPDLKKHKIQVKDWLKIAKENFAQVLYDIAIERLIVHQEKKAEEIKAEEKKLKKAKIKKDEELKVEIKAEESE